MRAWVPSAVLANGGPDWVWLAALGGLDGRTGVAEGRVRACAVGLRGLEGSLAAPVLDRARLVPTVAARGEASLGLRGLAAAAAIPCCFSIPGRGTTTLHVSRAEVGIDAPGTEARIFGLTAPCVPEASTVSSPPATTAAAAAG